MKKLNLEHLQVESFETMAPGERRAGTVRAHEHTCPGEYSCDPSCYGSCGATCDTGCLTCDAYCTADASCNKTCYGQTCYA
ncbi:MAG TPA: pinensin family lanthipeptide [Longimicrobium sp.]|nr:pinensin family lanthipeptide [Longimicrobium sp.]